MDYRIMDMITHKYMAAKMDRFVKNVGVVHERNLKAKTVFKPKG